MGNLTGTEGVNLPKYVQALGSVMAECSYTHKAHFMRRSSDTQTRRILSFLPSDRGRFIAELAWDQKKYSFDITPRDDVTFLDCGNAVVRAVKDYAPELLLNGEELFSPPPIDIFTRDENIVTPSHNDAAALPTESLLDDNHAPREDMAVRHDQEAAKSFTVPDDIWNARTLALYHAALELIFGSNDPSDYLLVDDNYGKIRALTEKMQIYFSAAVGSVHRALDPLRQYRIVEKETTTDNTPTGWWLVNFVTSAPPAKEGLKTLWDSRKGKQGQPLRPVLSASPNGPTPSVPEPPDIHAQNDRSRESDAHVSLPDKFDAKIETLRALQISLRADAHAEMNTLYVAIAEFCDKQDAKLARQQERFADFLTTQDKLRAQDISTLLKRLLHVASQGQ